MEDVVTLASSCPCLPKNQRPPAVAARITAAKAMEAIQTAFVFLWVSFITWIRWAWARVRFLAPVSTCAELPVPGISQPGQDVAMIVQAAVNGR